MSEQKPQAQYVELRADSLLWLINRTVFHPRGYALAQNTETGAFTLLGDGTEPWVFGGDGSDEVHHLARIKELMP
ncbi:hypothetical protein ACFORO_12390 [Amycolatopsis halotolerans]|uniref:Uncharacterized protein n=1 Tax=Amycolatopsis halotolerans TaxID=330083 RepID=A0ABV7QG63_9PSEU